jgi:ABC-type siderophore export system fused ATPase/permease subunit
MTANNGSTVELDVFIHLIYFINHRLCLEQMSAMSHYSKFGKVLLLQLVAQVLANFKTSIANRDISQQVP